MAQAGVKVPLPVEEGIVAAMNADGAGVIRDGKTVFVAGALPGEWVRFRRTRLRRGHDEADLIEVLRPSAQRVTPRCAHFGVCGGCVLQHLDGTAQLEVRQSELTESLQRIGKLAPANWLGPLAGPLWNYRRRARLGARYVLKKSRVLVGFRERLKPYVTDMQRCEILVDPVDALIEPLATLIGSLSIRADLPQIEVAVADDVVALVLRVMVQPDETDLQRLRDFEVQRGVRFYLQPGNLSTVHSLTLPAPRLSYRLAEFDIELEFEPVDFVQVNGALNAMLVSRAVELLGVDAQSRVLDLFCGLGNFSLALARRAGSVLGIEGEATLVERARANAARNGLANARFHAANLAADPLPMPPWPAQSFTHVLLDPPRAGAFELLPAIAQLAPQRIVYVSCHPGTLARDLGVLVHEHGYVLRAAGVVDMFPHTAHVESMAVLEPG